MEDKIKQIVAGFIKTPVEQVTVNTVIDRSSVNSSITLHRMYAKLAEAGIVVDQYHDIKTVGMLLQRTKHNGTVVQVSVPAASGNSQLRYSEKVVAAPGVGIDIEEIESMPAADDFREAEFYKQNFSASEIAYCIIQKNPYTSFAGLFAAKEAIVKADNSYRSMPFNTIVIEHNQDGKPNFGQLQLSVSHTNSLAIAVAVQYNNNPVSGLPPVTAPPASNAGNTILYWLLVICILLSGTALFVALKG